MEIENSLKERISRFQALASDLQTKVRTFSIFRVITFLLLIADLITIYRTGFETLYLVFFAILMIIFIWLISRHKYFDHQLQLHKELFAINEEEISRLHLRLEGLPSGKEFENDEHPYTQDLDIFGEHSLFQLINRSPMRAAKAMLAQWLSSKSYEDVILRRQSAVTELSGKNDWAQTFLATARVIAKKQKADKEAAELKGLFEWAAQPEQFKNLTLLRAAGVLLSLSVLTLMGFAFFTDFPYQYFIIAFFINAMLLGITFRKCKELGEQLNQSHLIVRTYLRLIESIEAAEFESDLLQQLKAQLNDGQASAAIRSLDKIAYRFASRGSMFYGILAPIFMLDYHLLGQAIAWKNTERTNIEKWFAAVDEFSVLISMGGFRNLQPDFVFPEFSETPFTFQGRSIGHPLIEAGKRVSNDFEMNKKGEVAIITGSNMSGKSTFERTLGINLVLAQMGAPVCATAFRIHPMDIFTSMRTKDNLEESTSSFYAELKRLRRLLDHVKTHPVTFYVIDEVLKGTNSEDRHKGAVSLARQLSELNCFGLISTHDLSLSEVADQYDIMVNYSFNSTIVDDQIIFDYKLTPGPCRSFNASKLMENMGIIQQENEALRS